MLHELVDGDIGIIDHCTDGITDFLQVVGSHVGRHTDGDTAGPVGEQEREGGGKHGRLLQGIVIVRAEIDRLLLDVLQHLLTDTAHFRFGVSHGRRRIPVDGTKVSLGIHYRVAQREVLGQTDQGIIDRGITMRVILAQNVTDDTSALLVG